MSDQTLNRFVASGTNAERLAFTPSPPTPASGPDSGYFFYETDTGDTFSWDGATWQQVNNTVGGITQLTSDVTAGPGSGSQAATIANNAVTDGKLRDSAALSVIGRSANSTGDPADIAAGSDHNVLRRSGTAIGFGAINLASSNAVSGLLPLANLAARTTDMAIPIGDGSGVIPTGIVQIDPDVPVNATLTKWRLLADQSGALVVDIWKDTYANYPPTVADTIIGGGGTKPTLSSQTKNEDSTLTGYTTSFSAGDTLRFNVDSATTVTYATLILTFSY